MPGRGEQRVLLPIDAKFPLADYERLLTAAETGEADAERQARRALGGDGCGPKPDGSRANTSSRR